MPGSGGEAGAVPAEAGAADMAWLGIADALFGGDGDPAVSVEVSRHIQPLCSVGEPEKLQCGPRHPVDDADIALPMVAAGLRLGVNKEKWHGACVADEGGGKWAAMPRQVADARRLEGQIFGTGGRPAADMDFEISTKAYGDRAAVDDKRKRCQLDEGTVDLYAVVADHIVINKRTQSGSLVLLTLSPPRQRG